MTIIRCVDLETTGLDGTKDAPCEIGWTDLIRGDDEAWSVGPTYSRLCNPGRAIPPEASAVHHITDPDVRGRPLWPVVLAETCGHADIAGQNVVAFAAHNTRFERLWISDEIVGRAHWLCTYRLALRLWPDAPSHSNQVLRYWRGMRVDFDGLPHRAALDSRVTAMLLRDLLGMATSRELLAWSAEPAILRRVNFGKHAGKTWDEVDTGYLRWTQGQDFDEDVRFTVETELERRGVKP
jgi:exodeoxyribonuclease X